MDLCSLRLLRMLRMLAAPRMYIPPPFYCKKILTHIFQNQPGSHAGSNRPPNVNNAAEGGSRMLADRSRIVIVCAKSYEAAAMSKILASVKLAADKTWQAPTAPSESKSLFVSYAYAFDQCEIRLVTFGNAQGPVTCAARLPLIIETYKPNAIIMPGVCGGFKLGRVIVGQSCIGLDLGRTEYNWEKNTYENQHEFTAYTGTTKYFESGLQAVLPLVNGQPKLDTILGLQASLQAARDATKLIGMDRILEEEIDVVQGGFISVTKVRDDVFEVIRDFGSHLKSNVPPDQIGVEMESLALFSVAEAYNTDGNLKIGAIAVVKAVSDCGWESFDPDHASPLGMDIHKKYVDHNLAEMKKVNRDFRYGKGIDNKANRKLYRNRAALNAAIVVWRIVQAWMTPV